MSHIVLLVDDEPNVLHGLSRALRRESYEILTAGSAEEAGGILEENLIDLIISDEEMPGMSGTEFLARVAGEYPDIVRIVLTGHPTLPTALRAINEGKVHQFLTKPCNEIDLAITVRRALEQKDLQEKSRALLEVTKKQSALIEEARMLRRLRNHPPRDTSAPIAGGVQPAADRTLVEQIEDEIQRGSEVLEPGWFTTEYTETTEIRDNDGG